MEYFWLTLVTGKSPNLLQIVFVENLSISSGYGLNLKKIHSFILNLMFSNSRSFAATGSN